MKAQRRFGHTWLLWLEPEENHVLNLAVDGFRAILLGSCLLYTSDAADE